MQAAAQVDQLNTKIQAQDWTRDINYRDQATGLCPSCGQETGGGKFCQDCGTPLAAAQAGEEVLRQLRQHADRREVLRRVRHPGG